MKPYRLVDGTLVQDVVMLRAWSGHIRGSGGYSFGPDELVTQLQADTAADFVRLGYAEYYDGDDSQRLEFEANEREARLKRDQQEADARARFAAEKAAELETASVAAPVETAAVKPRKAPKKAE